MKDHKITDDKIQTFGRYLQQEERAEATIQKYLHDVTAFSAWLGDRELTKEAVTEWKTVLFRSGRAAVTVNASLAALHSFLEFNGWQECRVKYLKVQRQLFRENSRELSKSEYSRLVRTAQSSGKKQTALLMEAICATGVRVSEVKYITVEAARRGRADISMKGKIRTILIQEKLARKLLQYAQKQKIASGEIFLTASGKGMSRKQIWKEMKLLCKAAGVAESKVFPHNLRHLFARAFYRACRDIVSLADVLGHSSIETTRIYLIATGEEHARVLDGLQLVC